MTKDRTPIDYGNVPITKLPPGKAVGADDLTNWAQRRATGLSGDAPLRKDRAAIMHCQRCNATYDILINVKLWKKKAGEHHCRKCGQIMKFIRFKRPGFKPRSNT